MAVDLLLLSGPELDSLCFSDDSPKPVDIAADGNVVVVVRMTSEGDSISDGEAFLVRKVVCSSCFEVEVSMMDSTIEYIKRNVRCVRLKAGILYRMEAIIKPDTTVSKFQSLLKNSFPGVVPQQKLFVCSLVGHARLISIDLARDQASFLL